MDQAYSSGPRPTLKVMLEAYERRLIEEALSAAGGCQRRAARALWVLPTSLLEKLKRLGLLQRPSTGPVAANPGEAPTLIA